MHSNRIFHRSLIFTLMAFALYGCSSSSGGGSDDDDTLVYQGRTTPADITSGNAADLTGDVVATYGIIGDDNLELRSADAETAGPADRMQNYAMSRIADIRNDQVADFVQATANSTYAARTEIDETSACEQGELRTVGFLEDDLTGTITLIFDNCQEGGDFLDGAMTFRIDSFDFGNLIETSLQLSFSNLRIRDSEFDVSLGGSVTYSADTANNQQTETVPDLVILDNTSGEMLRIVDLVNVYTYDNIFVPTRVTIDILSGRIYVSTHGYVDLTSTVVIDFTSITQSYPDSGVYNLTANGSIRATAIDTTTVQIDADTDGNPGNGYEYTTTLNWSDL